MKAYLIKKILLEIAKKAKEKRNRQKILFACIFLPLFIILAVISSPFAIFLGDNTEEKNNPIVKLDSLYSEFKQKVLTEQQDNTVNEIITVYIESEDNTIIDNRVDVLSVFAVKYAMSDDEETEQVFVLGDNQVKKLEKLYWDMNHMWTEIEEIKKEIEVEYVDEDGNVEKRLETIIILIKYIYVDSKTAEEMAKEYDFDELQTETLAELKQMGYETFYTYEGKTLSYEEIQAIKALLPADIDENLEHMINISLDIVGEVPYFWGGKSHAIGKDKRWNTPKKVTAAGSKTSGTTRPFGLDCSGYVTWAFIQMGLDIDTIEQTVGHGTTAQWGKSIEISESEVRVGDLVFMAPPNSKGNHVGIVVGIDENGELLIAHSRGDKGMMVTDMKGGSFKHYRRLAILTD